MTNTAEIFQFPDRRDDGQSQGPQRSGRSIQVEDGFTRTANALVEAFARSPLTSREARVIRVVERMTYGWNKAEDWIAASVISEMTGMSEGKCSETLNGLIRKRVLIRDGGGRSPVRINKHVDEWDFKAQKSRVTPKRNPNPEWGKSPQNGVSESPQNGVTPKDTKDNKYSLTTFESVVHADTSNEYFSLECSPQDPGPEPQSASNQVNPTASSDRAPQPIRDKPQYPEAFEALWREYPKRTGSNPKRAAFQAWNARLNEGVSHETLIASVQRYAAHIRSRGDSGSQFVMQAKRFLGPNAEYESEWPVIQPQNNVSAPRRDGRLGYCDSGFQHADYGRTELPAWMEE